MDRESAIRMAVQGQLYPGVILHGSDQSDRITVGVELARALLCEASPENRPCGQCRHCRRIAAPGDDSVFHPDFVVVGRDLKTATSVGAVKEGLRAIQLRPFEARGQVFLIERAETLTPGAQNALLKNLEEPPSSAPRHFLFLAPSSVELLPTLRSRSLSLYLGAAGDLAESEQCARVLADRLAPLIARHVATPSGIDLLLMARVMHDAADFTDPRDERGWSLGASALSKLSARPEARARAAALLGAAEDLLQASRFRSRGIPALRLLEGLLARHLAGEARRPIG